MTRRLAAILAADVVGYSALMEQDEAGTVARLIAFRKSLFDPAVADHSGRIVKLMGDGALVEFASVADAVNCALAIQTGLADQPEHGFQLRIGVNLGDVVSEGGDIYGDGVNIAARLEALAAPGGVCISETVQQSIGNRVDAEFTGGDARTLKNIARPVNAYFWSPAPAPSPARTEPDGAPPGADTRPGIAVLAFDNMSAEPDQEYFSDGIAEDIITALSHFREFFVIARNTSFSFKGQSIRVDEICRELNIRYLLEGSVRKAGNRVRVTAQLIDGTSGAHVWADRYDRAMDDIFAVQDEITQAIVSAVAPETLEAELQRSRMKQPDSLSAWDKLLRARWHMARMTKEEHDTARGLLGAALAEAPTLSDAHSELALCDLRDMLHLWQEDAAGAIASAEAHARRAVDLDPNNANAFAILGVASVFARKYDDGQRFIEQSIRLNPNMANGYGTLAPLYGVEGDYARAREFAERAMALSPRDPQRCFWLAGVGISAFIAGEYQDCVDVSRNVLKDFPGYASSMRQEAAALAMLGRMEEARLAVDRLLERMPGLTVSQVRHMVPVRYPDDIDRWLGALRRAGLPD